MENEKDLSQENNVNNGQDDTPTNDNLTEKDDIQDDKATSSINKEAPESTNKEEKPKSLFGKKTNKEIAQLKEEIAELKGKNEELTIEKQELNDKFLRLYSEFDNYKKRTNKEKLDIISTASEKVIVSMLPIVDDFERAIQANEKVEDIKVIKEGFELIYNKLIQLLKRFEVEEIEAKGTPFNTDFHEAITHFPASNEEDKGKVMDVTEKGYKLKDKVIRFSKVVVAN